MPPFKRGNYMDAITNKFIHLSLNKIKCPINIARWMPDARRILTGAATGEFTLWNGITFNFETIMQAHDAAIRAMTWNHAGDFLITGDHLGILKIWQPTMNNVKILEAHKEPIRAVAFSPSDMKFASCSDEGTVKIWDFAKASEDRTLLGHGWDVKTVDWHPVKALIASGSKDNLVKLWDPRTGTSLANIHGHKNMIIDVKWNKNGLWLLSCGKDQNIKLTDIRMLKELATFRAHKKEVNTVAWHPTHESLFASGGAEGAIHYWQVDNPEEPLCSLEGAHDGIIWSLDWHPIGHVLCSTSGDFSTRFWTRGRPGDTFLDKYVMGKQAAEKAGIKPTIAMTLMEQQQQDGNMEDYGFMGGMGMGGNVQSHHQQYQQLPGLSQQPIKSFSSEDSTRSLGSSFSQSTLQSAPRMQSMSQQPFPFNSPILPPSSYQQQSQQPHHYNQSQQQYQQHHHHYNQQQSMGNNLFSFPFSDNQNHYQSQQNRKNLDSSRDPRRKK